MNDGAGRSPSSLYLWFRFRLMWWNENDDFRPETMEDLREGATVSFIVFGEKFVV